MEYVSYQLGAVGRPGPGSYEDEVLESLDDAIDHVESVLALRFDAGRELAAAYASLDGCRYWAEKSLARHGVADRPTSWQNNLQALFEGNETFRRDAVEACMVNVACPCFETAEQAEEWLRSPASRMCQPYASGELRRGGGQCGERRDDAMFQMRTGHGRAQGTGNSL